MDETRSKSMSTSGRRSRKRWKDVDDEFVYEEVKEEIKEIDLKQSKLRYVIKDMSGLSLIMGQLSSSWKGTIYQLYIRQKTFQR